MFSYAESYAETSGVGDLEGLYDEKKMEKLRKQNEQLRECGVYWHDACKEAVRDLLGKAKAK